MNTAMTFETAKSILVNANIQDIRMTEAAQLVASDVSLCQRLADEANLAIRAVMAWGLVMVEYPTGWAYVAPLVDQSMIVH